MKWNRKCHKRRYVGVERLPRPQSFHRHTCTHERLNKPNQPSTLGLKVRWSWHLTRIESRLDRNATKGSCKLPGVERDRSDISRDWARFPSMKLLAHSLNFIILSQIIHHDIHIRISQFCCVLCCWLPNKQWEEITSWTYLIRRLQGLIGALKHRL